MCVCVCTCVCARACTCEYLCMYMRVWLGEWVRECVCTCVCTCACVLGIFVCMRRQALSLTRSRAPFPAYSTPSFLLAQKGTNRPVISAERASWKRQFPATGSTLALCWHRAPVEARGYHSAPQLQGVMRIERERERETQTDRRTRTTWQTQEWEHRDTISRYLHSQWQGTCVHSLCIIKTVYIEIIMYTLYVYRIYTLSMYTKLQGICAYITETERGTHTHTHVAGASFKILCCADMEYLCVYVCSYTCICLYT